MFILFPPQFPESLPDNVKVGGEIIVAGVDHVQPGVDLRTQLSFPESILGVEDPRPDLRELLKFRRIGGIITDPGTPAKEVSPIIFSNRVIYLVCFKYIFAGWDA